MRLAYDNIPVEHRGQYRISGWRVPLRVEGGVSYETNVKQRVDGVLRWVEPDAVPAEWVTD